MRALLVLVAACTPTFTDHFLEVRPVSSPLAHGTRCNSICGSKRPFDGIDFCAVAKFEGKPRLVCSVHHIRSDASGIDLDWLVDIPAGADVPVSGPVPIELCAPGCKAHLEHDQETITACAVYPFRPDKTAPFLVCSFRKSRKAQTM